MSRCIKRVAFFIAVILICSILPFMFTNKTDKGFSVSVSDSIVNGSFENGKAQSKYGINYFIFDGWNVSNTMSANANTSIKHDENQSLTVSGITDFKLETANGVAVKGDSYYEFSFMAYSPQAQGASFDFKVDCYNNLDKITDTFSISAVEISDGEVWQKISVQGGTNTFAEYVKIYITINCANNSPCYIDNVKIIEKNFINIKEGASVRISEETPGIRFSGTIDKIEYENMKNRYKNVGVGIVIIPKSSYDGISEFTFYGIEQGEIQFLSIEAVIWNNSNTVEEDGFYGFNCAMVNIKKENIVREFCARAYLKYTDNGVEKFLYSDFNVLLNCRSVQNVALSVLEKESDALTDFDLAILQYYASGGQIS